MSLNNGAMSPPYDDWPLQSGAQLVRALNGWSGASHDPDDRYRAAAEAIHTALVATVAYMRKLRQSEPSNRYEEDRIGSLWQIAGTTVGPLDDQLASACFMKGMGWIDPEAWKRAEAKGIRIGIAEMEDALMRLNKQRAAAFAASKSAVPDWFPKAGVVFAAATILFLMAFLVFGTGIDAGKKTIFDVLIAFCAACAFTFFGGSLIADGKVPFLKDSPIGFSAGGGIAVFILVLVLMHNV